MKEKAKPEALRIDRAKSVADLFIRSYETAVKATKADTLPKTEKDLADKAVLDLKKEIANDKATPESVSQVYNAAFAAVKDLSDKIDGKSAETKPSTDVKKPETKPSTDTKKPETKPSAETKPSTDAKKPETKPSDSKVTTSEETKSTSTTTTTEPSTSSTTATKPSTSQQSTTQPSTTQSSNSQIKGKTPAKYADTNEKSSVGKIVIGSVLLVFAAVAGILGFKKFKESHESEGSEE